MHEVLYKRALSRGFGWPIRRYLGRPFPSGTPLRLLIYFHANRICFSQIYPFLFYAKELREAYGAEIRLSSVDELLAGISVPRCDADLILLQPWFSVDPAALMKSLDALRTANPVAKIAFLDSFAHGDIRLARYVEPFVSWYLKKSVFRNQSDYLRAWEGHTNLTDFYGRLYGLRSDPVDWQTPAEILNRLRLSPSFFTDHRFITRFGRSRAGWQATRTIDVHARMATRGPGWYSAMRNDALARIRGIRGLRIASRGVVSERRFLRELGFAKICLSPFGFGELCWRDIEAIMCGAVLLKQDMSHLRTLPELFEPYVTYFPVQWDFSDLEHVTKEALSNESLRQKVASEAYCRVADYLRKERFVADMGFLFTGDGP